MDSEAFLVQGLLPISNFLGTENTNANINTRKHLKYTCEGLDHNVSDHCPFRVEE